MAKVCPNAPEKEVEDHLVYILMASTGNRHEDSTPEAFITLDRFKDYAETKIEKMDHNHEDSIGDFYLTLLIPNKPVASEGNESVFFALKDGHRWVQFDSIKTEFDIDSPADYQRLIHQIKLLYKRI
jgi:hypothetical protein